MLKSRFEYKGEAEKLMNNKYGPVIGALLIFFVITAVLGTIQDQFATKYSWETLEVVQQGNPFMSFVMSILTFIAGSFIAYSQTKMFYDVVMEEKIVVEEVVLFGVKDNPKRTLVMSFMMNLYIALWTLLFIIPGIVKAYAYSMSYYIMLRNPNITATETIDQSKNLTRGHKMDIFMLDLSYLGWYFIGLFTLGILWLWIIPKHMTARMLYFDEIYSVAYPEMNVALENEEF